MGPAARAAEPELLEGHDDAWVWMFFLLSSSSELASAMCAHKSLFALRRFTWPESPQSMDTMPNGFDNAFNQYHMAAPIIG